METTPRPPSAGVPRRPITTMPERPSAEGASLRNDVAPRSAEAGRWTDRRTSPPDSTLAEEPVTKSVIGSRYSEPSARQTVTSPSSAAASEIIAPAGKDRQMFPPTVAVRHTLNDASSAEQHWWNSGAAAQSGCEAGNSADNADIRSIVHVAAMSIPLSSMVTGGHPSAVIST